jgi:phage tail-like protein
MPIRPSASFHFYVELKNVTQAVFTECSALQVETEVYEYKEGGFNTQVHRLPGRAKVSNITLKRGLARRSGDLTGPWNDDLWKWYVKVLQGTIERHDLSVIIYDTANGDRRVATWNIFGAYPVKWVGPAHKTGDNSVAVETLELAHRGLNIG